MLKSAQIQRKLYEQLLEEKYQQVNILTSKWDKLKFEKERLESQLNEVCYELRALKLEHTVKTATTTPDCSLKVWLVVGINCLNYQ